MVGTRKNEKKHFPVKWRLLKKELGFFQLFGNGFEFFLNTIEEIENFDFCWFLPKRDI